MMSRDRKIGLGIGVLLLGLGGWIIAIGAGWTPVGAESLTAPRWIVIAAGLVFFLPGVMCVTGRLVWLVVPTFGAFAAIPTWVAFGPGERDFGGAIGIGPLVVSGPAMEWFGRIFFGMFAVVLCGAFLRFCYDLLTSSENQEAAGESRRVASEGPGRDAVRAPGAPE